jgi:putative component of toxin-antitoxin plasmid stabilization module
VIEIRQLIGPGDKNYFEEGFNRLNAQAAAKVSTALARISCGNWSNVKGVGSAFTSTASILAPDTEFISEKRAIAL